jgi:hypothetical protein
MQDQSSAHHPKRDPGFEAILNKRSPYIESMYNKNLRPVRDKKPDANHNNDSDSKQQNQAAAPPVKEPTFNREITELELEKTFFNNFDSDSMDNFSSNNNQHLLSIQEYEAACFSLKIVPSSIVIKALPTTRISLANYGINSTGVLALVHALRKNFIVESLDLSGNEIGAHGLKHLAHLFTENLKIHYLVKFVF